MIMLIVTVILSALFMGILCVFTGRYSVRFLARRFYTVGELSLAFKEKYAESLAQCSIPCKRLISSRMSPTLGGIDNRPIIYAAGEIYSNEEVCNHLSARSFAAGLMYEQAHYDVGFYGYSGLMSLIILGGYLPLIVLVHKIMLSLTASYHPGLLVSLFGSTITFLYHYPLFFFFIIAFGIIKMEYALGASVVTFYADNGHDLEGLLAYLKYVESSVTPGLNQTFNISSNRKRCEALLVKSSS